jgi:hypothetical protein
MVKKKSLPSHIKRSPKVEVPSTPAPAPVPAAAPVEIEPDPNAFRLLARPFLQGVLLGRPCASIMSNHGPCFFYSNREVVL